MPRNALGRGLGALIREPEPKESAAPEKPAATTSQGAAAAPAREPTPAPNRRSARPESNPYDRNRRARSAGRGLARERPTDLEQHHQHPRNHDAGERRLRPSRPGMQQGDTAVAVGQRAANRARHAMFRAFVALTDWHAAENVKGQVVPGVPSTGDKQ